MSSCPAGLFLRNPEEADEDGGYGDVLRDPEHQSRFNALFVSLFVWGLLSMLPAGSAVSDPQVSTAS